MLDDVPADRRKNQYQKRNGHRRDHLATDFLKQPGQGRTVHTDIIGVGYDPAHRGREISAHRAGERHQDKRGTGDDKPGIDLLAFDDITAFERLVKPLLGWFFCFVDFGFFRHASPSSETWSKIGKNAVEIIDKRTHHCANHYQEKQKAKNDGQR